jgi:hypothetical protein
MEWNLWRFNTKTRLTLTIIIYAIGVRKFQRFIIAIALKLQRSPTSSIYEFELEACRRDSYCPVSGILKDRKLGATGVKI